MKHLEKIDQIAANKKQQLRFNPSRPDEVFNFKGRKKV